MASSTYASLVKPPVVDCNVVYEDNPNNLEFNFPFPRDYKDFSKRKFSHRLRNNGYLLAIMEAVSKHLKKRDRKLTEYYHNLAVPDNFHPVYNDHFKKVTT